MSEPRVVILGAGPAGVGAARELARDGRARVTVVEQRQSVGGNAGSFTIAGQRVDYGSHRLHPACEPEILEDIRSLLGDELVERPRHGRIRLRDRWIHFPLKPLDLLLRVDPSFAAGALRDGVIRLVGSGSGEASSDEASFASVLESSLGPTICREFYFPYARKIWGREPGELSAEQAERRVSANTVGKLVRKVLGRLPGVESAGFSHFYYPKGGYGRISEAFADDARRCGADFLLGWRADRVSRDLASGGWTVVARRDDERRELPADYVWSTVPIPLLARLVDPPPSDDVLDAAAGISYRSMLLIYLTLSRDRFTQFDAHYFPGEEVSITRLSEPKNYAGTREPRGRTTLCAELPCSRGDAEWSMSDEELAGIVSRDIRRAGLDRTDQPEGVHTVRLSHAYPIYHRGYEEPFDRLDDWARGLPGLLTYGRQGLFAHDNTHHALAMAYAAADCLAGGRFDAERWASYREDFEDHVVED